ncbi:MAG TPA: electron transfer flavoprotein subunit alpha/FixB family protein [Myxococcota bacterium]|nr:electron transfer flavoprotein subunit alpha/FixB family protein [Myxococcota bacterium]HRY96742.1 electron transfer flavoprotein subunit alpha/FixB family protein [Myxococcota bacterium]
MGNVLILAEHKDGTIKKVCRAAFTFAKQYAAKQGGQVHILVMGPGAGKAAEEAMCYGAAKVHVAEHPALQSYLAESYAIVVAEVAKAIGASVVGATSSSMTKDMLPRVAAKLGAGMCSDIVGTDDQGHFLRPVWAGNAIVAAEITSPIKVVSVRATEFAPAEKGAAGGEKSAVAVNVDLAKLRKRFVKFEEIKSSRPELTEASVIVSGGRGTKGDFKVIEQLADLLHGAVGATRAAVDAGWVPNDLQVGQTGKVVAPDLYFALGMSGAIQHLAGMKGSKVIVAVNKDEEAPIFGVADYGLVGDLFKAVPEMIEEIKKAKG